MSKDEPPIGSVGLSAFAVALIFVVWPLIMGGSISLAIFFGEEIEGESAPEDANGFRFLDMPPSSCNPIMNNPSTSVLYNPNSVNFGNGTTVTFYGVNGNPCQSQATMILQIPTPLMNQEDSISEMRYEFLGTGYSTNPPSSFDTARMDIELKDDRGSTKEMAAGQQPGCIQLVLRLCGRTDATSSEKSAATSRPSIDLIFPPAHRSKCRTPACSR